MNHFPWYEYKKCKWDVKHLWSLQLAVEKKPIVEFIWLLDEKIWASNAPDQIFDLEPSEVLANPQNTRGVPGTLGDCLSVNRNNYT